MKKFLFLWLLFIMVSCAGLQAVMTNQNMAASLKYFQMFVGGVEAAVPWMRMYFPDAVETIDKVLMPALERADSLTGGLAAGIDLYAAGKMGIAELGERKDSIYALIQTINEVVGMVKGVK